MQDFEECQDDKHGHERHVELFPEDCHGQRGLHHCLTKSLVHSLDFSIPQLAKEYLDDRKSYETDHMQLPCAEYVALL